MGSVFSLRRCVPDDLSTLVSLSRETFSDAFAADNSPERMDAYLAEAFDEDGIRECLSDDRISYYFAYCDGELAGYLKLNEGDAQTDIHDPASMEVERIYVLRRFQDRGLGGRLIDAAAEIAGERGKDYLWLGVWERNDGAIRFYRRHGFREFGTHMFDLGGEPQRDLLMRRDISGRSGIVPSSPSHRPKNRKTLTEGIAMVATVPVSDGLVSKATAKAVRDGEDARFLKGLLSEQGPRGLSSPRASRCRPSSCRC